MDVSSLFKNNGLIPDSPDTTLVWPSRWDAVIDALGDAIPGGTAITSYAVGDLLYASSTSALSKLADVAVGSVLVSGGVGAAPAWATNLVISGQAAVTSGTFGSPPGALTGKYLTAGYDTTANAAFLTSANWGTGYTALRLQGSPIGFYIASTNVWNIDGSNGNLVDAGSHAIAIGPNPATIGALRLANAGAVMARDSANTADGPLLQLATEDVTVMSSVERTISNDGVIMVGTTNALGALIISAASPGVAALFLLANTTATEVSDPQGWFSPTAGSAGLFNVYWSAANSRYEIENKTGVSRTVRIVRLGQ
jgi:hypothetical protein